MAAETVEQRQASTAAIPTAKKHAVGLVDLERMVVPGELVKELDKKKRKARSTQ